MVVATAVDAGPVVTIATAVGIFAVVVTATGMLAGVSKCSREVLAASARDSSQVLTAARSRQLASARDHALTVASKCSRRTSYTRETTTVGLALRWSSQCYSRRANGREHALTAGGLQACNYRRVIRHAATEQTFDPEQVFDRTPRKGSGLGLP